MVFRLAQDPDDERGGHRYPRGHSYPEHEAAQWCTRDSHDGPSRNVPVEMMLVAITKGK
jgi:hypothetical protein